MVRFDSVTQDRWDSIFGAKSPEQRIQERDAAIKEQNRRKEQVQDVAAPAIHDDRLYKGFNIGLGEHTEGRTHTRELAKRMGLRPCG